MVFFALALPKFREAGLLVHARNSFFCVRYFGGGVLFGLFFFFETMRQREPLSSPGDTSFNPLSFRQAARDRHFALGVAFVRFENQSREQSLQRSNRRARQGSSQASHHRLPQSPFMYVNSFEYMRLNWAACLVRNQTSYSLRITSRSVSPVEDEAARRGTSLESCI